MTMFIHCEQLFVSICKLLGAFYIMFVHLDIVVSVIYSSACMMCNTMNCGFHGPGTMYI